MPVKKLEAQLQKLEDYAVHKNQENVRLKELLHQKENDFEVEVSFIKWGSCWSPDITTGYKSGNLFLNVLLYMCLIKV